MCHYFSTGGCYSMDWSLNFYCWPLIIISGDENSLFLFVVIFGSFSILSFFQVYGLKIFKLYHRTVVGRKNINRRRQVGLHAKFAGAYCVGEVVRKEIGGQWLFGGINRDSGVFSDQAQAGNHVCGGLQSEKMQARNLGHRPAASLQAYMHP